MKSHRAIQVSLAIQASLAMLCGWVCTIAQAASPVPGQQVEQSFKAKDAGEVPYLLYLPEDFEPSKSLPIMLFLHGRGESDGPLIAVLSLFCDLVPLPWTGPLAAFREACENRADRLAAESAGAVHLASALVAAAGGGRRLRPAHAFGLGGPEVLRLRLQRLLHGPSAEPGGRKGRLTLACGLFALVTIAGLPIAQARMICTDHIEGRLAQFSCPYHTATVAAHVTTAKPRSPATTAA